MRRRRIVLIVLLLTTATLWLGREPLMRMAGRVLYPFPFRTTIFESAHEAAVDPMLVVAVIREESGFAPKARSRAGAIGLMQLMPDTARWIAKKQNREMGDLEDPGTNIRLGSAYLGYLSRQFKGDLPRVLAAYNGGQGNVARWKDLSEAFPETKRYVKRSLSSYAAYRWIYGDAEPVGGPAAAARLPERSR